MKLYFGNAVATATTLMILAMLGFIGFSVYNRESIQYWGRRSAFLLVFGLVVCCFAAARDGLDKTIQNTIDGSCAPECSRSSAYLRYRLCRRDTYNHCRSRYAYRKNSESARDMVLHNVGRCDAENHNNGNRALDFLNYSNTDNKRRENNVREKHNNTP